MNGDRTNCVLEKKSSVGEYSRDDRHRKSYKPNGIIFVQNHTRYTNTDTGGRNLQKISKSKKVI